jgi:hypothetical protein
MSSNSAKAAAPAASSAAPQASSGPENAKLVLISLILAAAVALLMAWKFVPANVHETTEPVDNLGGLPSMVLVGTLILGINFAPVPDELALAVGLFAVAIVATALFLYRQRKAKNPLYDLNVARRWAPCSSGSSSLTSPAALRRPISFAANGLSAPRR